MTRLTLGDGRTIDVFNPSKSWHATLELACFDLNYENGWYSDMAWEDSQRIRRALEKQINPDAYCKAKKCLRRPLEGATTCAHHTG